MNTEFLNHYILLERMVGECSTACLLLLRKQKWEKVVLKHFPEFAGEIKGGDRGRTHQDCRGRSKRNDGWQRPIWMDTSTATPRSYHYTRTTSDFHILRKHKILPDAWSYPGLKQDRHEKEKIEIEPIFIVEMVH